MNRRNVNICKAINNCLTIKTAAELSPAAMRTLVRNYGEMGANIDAYKDQFTDADKPILDSYKELQNKVNEARPIIDDFNTVINNRKLIPLATATVGNLGGIYLGHRYSGKLLDHYGVTTPWKRTLGRAGGIVLGSLGGSTLGYAAGQPIATVLNSKILNGLTEKELQDKAVNAFTAAHNAGRNFTNEAGKGWTNDYFADNIAHVAPVIPMQDFNPRHNTLFVHKTRRIIPSTPEQPFSPDFAQTAFFGKQSNYLKINKAINNLLRTKVAYNWVAGAAGAAAGGTAGGLAGTWLADHVGLKDPQSMLGRFGRKALQYGGATAGIVGGSMLGKVNFGKIFGHGGGKRGALVYDKSGKPITVDAKGNPIQLSQADADKLLETRMSSFDKQYRARIANAGTREEAQALRDNYQKVKQERLRGFRKQIYKKHGVNLENDPGALQSAIGGVRSTLAPYTGLAGDIGTIGGAAFMVPSAIAAGAAGISALKDSFSGPNNAQQGTQQGMQQQQQQPMQQQQQQGMMPQQQGFSQQEDDQQQPMQQQQGMTPQQYQQMMYQRQMMMMQQQQGGGYYQ